jgi:lambda family phage portal protein
MNMLDRLIAQVSPARGLSRARARKVLDILAHYDAATTGRRSKSWVASGSDADGANGRRQRLAYIARDMVRNTPFAARAQQVIANNVIGDGIIPKIIAPTPALQSAALAMIEAHLDSTSIDSDGVCNFYGLQRLALNTVIDSGEVLIRRRRREAADRLPLPFQIQVMEPDFIDSTKEGRAANGNEIREGIEYDLIGRRVGYYLFSEHPGKASGRLRSWESRRVPASEIIHIFRVDRPGQKRGVSWFSGVALQLQDLGDHQDAQMMRQKIAACFAAFRVAPDDLDTATADEMATSLKPGAIMDLAPGEDIKFAVPPGVEGYDEFTRSVLRSIAAGMGITYEALAGDLSNVNFSSGRMGRMEMDRNVSSWQWLMMIPQFLGPFGGWLLEAWMLQIGDPRVMKSRIEWVPPHRIIVDPAREIPAMITAIRGGLASRQGTQRALGYDPERLMDEIKEDRVTADAADVQFDSDPRKDASKLAKESDNAE